MSRKFLLAIIAGLLIGGCRVGQQAEVFRGDVVATLQTPTFATPPGSANLGNSSQAELTSSTGEAGVEASPTQAPPDQGGYPVALLPGAAGTPTENATLPAPLTFDASAWAGNWHIWLQNVSGSYASAELHVSVKGLSLKGAALIEGKPFTLKGDILAGGNQVKGDWVAGASSGTFWWRMNSAGLFSGSSQGQDGFCGSQTNTTRPANCRELPQN